MLFARPWALLDLVLSTSRRSCAVCIATLALSFDRARSSAFVVVRAGIGARIRARVGALLTVLYCHCLRLEMSWLVRAGGFAANGIASDMGRSSIVHGQTKIGVSWGGKIMSKGSVDTTRGIDAGLMLLHHVVLCLRKV